MKTLVALQQRTLSATVTAAHPKTLPFAAAATQNMFTKRLAPGQQNYALGPRQPNV